MGKSNVEKECVICGKLFIPKTANQKCCSPECSDKRIKQYNVERYREQNNCTGSYERTCVVCWKKFITNHPRKITCSNECSVIRHNESNRISYRNNKHIVKSRNKNISNSKKLSNDALEARNLGVSYGTYVAMKYMEWQNERTKKVIRN